MSARPTTPKTNCRLLTFAQSRKTQWLEELLTRVARHEPELDLDGDGFSLAALLRGANWRGKDCGPFESTVYPGKSDID